MGSIVKVRRATTRHHRSNNGAWSRGFTSHDVFEIDEDKLRPQRLTADHVGHFSLNDGITVTWPDGTVEQAYKEHPGSAHHYKPRCYPAGGRLETLLTSEPVAEHA